MKLKEILVQELPKRGGWPEDVHALVQNSSGCVYQTGWGENLYILRLADDWMNTEVTREQYESALAAAQNVEWDGVGMPPVGSTVEIAASTQHLQIRHPEGSVVKIYAVFTDDRGVELAAFIDAIGQVGGVGTEKCFRPTRSEADKKRKETINLMDKRFKEILAAGSTEAMAIFATVYDTIAAGEIPGANVE